MPSRLLTTTQAATELGIASRTLAQWWHDGKVAPSEVTLGGHARWDVDDLRRQIREWRDRERDDGPETPKAPPPVREDR